MRVWDPREDLGGLTEPDVKEATFLLWKGHCTVHQRFRPEHVAAFRAKHPDGEVLVHPECSHDVVVEADRVGSTERILEWVDAAPPARCWGSPPRSTWCSASASTTPTRRSSRSTRSSARAPRCSGSTARTSRGAWRRSPAASS